MKVALTFATLLSSVLLVTKGYSVGTGAGSRAGSETERIVKPLPLPLNNETNFFDNLNKDEQAWLMNTSLVVHLNEYDVGTLPVRQEMQVPNSLAPKILNGQVPVDFQKRFSKWIIEEHHLTNEHLRALVNGKEACGDKMCSPLPGYGQGCCPFG